MYLLFIRWNPDPVIFDFGFFSLRWYSLLFATGFIISYILLKKVFEKNSVDIKLLDKLTLYVFIGTLVGARLGHCLFYDFGYYSKHLVEIFLPVQFSPQFKFTGYQGLASHGGATGILLSLLLFAHRYKLSILWLLDKLALVIPLAACCIRLGNLMNSEIIGKPSAMPWAFIFEREDMIPRHPGQLYEAIAYLLIFLILNVASQKNRKPGFIFGLFLVLLFSARLILEFFKENQSAFESGLTLNMGQLLSIPFIIAGIILIVHKKRADAIS